MNTTVLALVAAASLVATYFFCLRPMWRGRCGVSGRAGSSDEDLRGQIAELQEEIRTLRAQDALADQDPPPVRRRQDG
ncbi:MAG: hypothetical protein ACRDTE_25855 [Pseudonocardiaceae bacterium]